MTRFEHVGACAIDISAIIGFSLVITNTMCGYTFGAIIVLISMIVIFILVEYRRFKALTW